MRREDFISIVDMLLAAKRSPTRLTMTTSVMMSAEPRRERFRARADMLLVASLNMENRPYPCLSFTLARRRQCDLPNETLLDHFEPGRRDVSWPQAVHEHLELLDRAEVVDHFAHE